MLESNSFVVRERALRRSSRRLFDIHDGESGEHLGTARQSASWYWVPFGLFLGKKSTPVRTEIRERIDDSLVFVLEKNGWLSSRIEVVDSEGDPIGSYHSHSFRFLGGYAIDDRDGNRFAEIRGKFLTSEYTIVTPDGKAELARVSRQWDGMARALFTTARTYGVRIDPDFSEHPFAKMLILGAALAIDELVGSTRR